MKTILILMLLTFVVEAVAQTDSTREQQSSSSNYIKQKQAVKPETNAQESGTQGTTQTIQGKSGTQGQTGKTQPASGTKVQNESGVQGETGSLSGKSGTQGQTTQGETSDSLQREASGSSTPTETSDKRDTQHRSEEIANVNPELLPDVLRETLRNDDYKGWENGRIYHDKLKNEYLLEMVRENKKVSYRFDKQGKPLTDKN